MILIGIMYSLVQGERQAKNSGVGYGYGMISTWSFTTGTKHLTRCLEEPVRRNLKKYTVTKSSWIYSENHICKEGRMTQVERVSKYMDDFGSISTREAFIELGITRLASRIYDLTRMGVSITKTTEAGKNKYGETVHYTRYSKGA